MFRCSVLFVHVDDTGKMLQLLSTHTSHVLRSQVKVIPQQRGMEQIQSCQAFFTEYSISGR